MTTAPTEAQRRRESADQGMIVSYWADRHGDRRRLFRRPAPDFTELNRNANRWLGPSAGEAWRPGTR